jgi:hypothetical protein
MLVVGDVRTSYGQFRVNERHITTHYDSILCKFWVKYSHYLVNFCHYVPIIHDNYLQWVPSLAVHV